MANATPWSDLPFMLEVIVVGRDLLAISSHEAPLFPITTSVCAGLRLKRHHGFGAWRGGFDSQPRSHPRRNANSRLSPSAWWPWASTRDRNFGQCLVLIASTSLPTAHHRRSWAAGQIG